MSVGVVLIASTGVGSNNLKIGVPLPGQEPGLLERRKLAEHACMRAYISLCSRQWL